MFGTLRDKVRAIIQAIVGWTETTIIGHSLLMTGRVVWAATMDVLRGDLQVRAASLVYSALLALVQRFPDLRLVDEGTRIKPFFLWGRRTLPVTRG